MAKTAPSSLLPTLDVVLPSYNEEGEIAACLDALLIQSKDIHKIIVVDNNSTDDTVKIVKEYRARFPKHIRLLREKKQGVQYARNTGFDEATAEIVARIDVDTRVSPAWAHELRAYYQAHPEAHLATGATTYYDLPARRLTDAMTWFFMHSTNERIAGSISLYGANMSLRRSTWQAIKPSIRMDEDIMEDLAISLAVQQLGDFRVAYIPGAFARVSGRRIRTKPQQFARYNTMWWRTYEAYGQHRQARLIRVCSWFGDALQAVVAYFLQYHDPKTGKFSLRKVSRYSERILP